MAPSLPRKLWEHPNPKSTKIWAFREKLEQEKGIKLPVYVLLAIIQPRR